MAFPPSTSWTRSWVRSCTRSRFSHKTCPINTKCISDTCKSGDLLHNTCFNSVWCSVNWYATSLPALSVASEYKILRSCSWGHPCRHDRVYHSVPLPNPTLASTSWSGVMSLGQSTGLWSTDAKMWGIMLRAAEYWGGDGSVTSNPFRASCNTHMGLCTHNIAAIHVTSHSESQQPFISLIIHHVPFSSLENTHNLAKPKVMTTYRWSLHSKWLACGHDRLYPTSARTQKAHTSRPSVVRGGCT
jgi:hypothetical protein